MIKYKSILCAKCNKILCYFNVEDRDMRHDVLLNDFLCESCMKRAEDERVKDKK